jgi:hypothetical protein
MSGDTITRQRQRDQTLKPVDASEISSRRCSATGEVTAKFSGNPAEAVWLPNDVVAKAWVEYVKTGATSDTRRHPAPLNVKGDAQRSARDGYLEAEADFEWHQQFIVLRDGQELARVAEKPVGKFSRRLNDRRIDTPSSRCRCPWTLRPRAVAPPVTVNSVGLKSGPRASPGHESWMHEFSLEAHSWITNIICTQLTDSPEEDPRQFRGKVRGID